MQNIKLVIFDLDGTLVDAYAAISSSFNYVMRKLRLKPRSAGSIRGLVCFVGRVIMRGMVMS